MTEKTKVRSARRLRRRPHKATAPPVVSKPLAPMPVVLGGGARRGAYLVGLLRLIDEVKLPVSHFTGISIGSLASALYTNGKAPDEIGEILTDELFKYNLYGWANPKNWITSMLEDPSDDRAAWQNWINALRPTWDPWKMLSLGVMDILPVIAALTTRHKIQPQPNFRSIAFDLIRLKPVIFGGDFKGTKDKAIFIGPDYDIAIGVAASCCVAGPGLMKPVNCHIEGEHYLLVDGGYYHPHPGIFNDEPSIIAKLIVAPRFLARDRDCDIHIDLGASGESFFSKITDADLERMSAEGYRRAREVFVAHGLIP
jgi:predicted acylesterase/phospholipase RssA